MSMKNKEKLFFSILLLVVNTAGAVGALVTTLQFTWGTVLEPALFLWGVGLLCVLSALFWRPVSRKGLLIQAAVLLAVYSLFILVFREKLLNGLAWELDEAVSRLNSRHNIQLIWNRGVGEDALEMTRTATVSALTVLVPFILLLGYGVMRSHVIAIIMADAIWFVAACGLDIFPAHRWIVLCVLGLGAVIIRRAYRNDERAGVWATFSGVAVLGAVMLLVYQFMPLFDEKYDATLEVRIELYQKMNEEWIPQIQKAFSQFGSGIGGGVDVTGELTRAAGTIYTTQEIYRVTLDTAPKTAVYLRGFVGKDYTGDEWKEDKDSALERYYRERGWELPEDGGKLVNLTYEAFRRRTSGYVRIEELAGAGSYSIYPYGAEMTEDYKVHWDGSAEWKSSVYEFPYCAPGNTDEPIKLAGEQAEEELRYRSYVYDNFCEYPEERFPKLTEFLEEAGFRTDNLYESLADVLSYLRNNDSYNLNAGNPPAGEDFVEYFLFESHEGYCAHFASAAVLMLRYLGIPARYATGYSVSANAFSRDEDGTYTAVITDKQAHAWAEVYLDGVGWIPVEMTPGAAAFTRDNSIEQLTLAGQLSGAFTGNARESDRQETQNNVTGESEENSADNQEEAPKQQPEQGEEPAGSGSTVKQGQDEPVSGNSVNSITADSAAEQTEIGKKNLSSAEKRWELSPRTAAALKGILGFIFFLLFCYGTVYLIRLRGYRRLCRADNREKIFLVYHNLKKLLLLSGCPGRLTGDEEEVCDFRRILEKSSFGAQEPTEAELRRVMKFCRRIAGEEYGKLPLYKRPVYKCLNVYI